MIDYIEDGDCIGVSVDGTKIFINVNDGVSFNIPIYKPDTSEFICAACGRIAPFEAKVGDICNARIQVDGFLGEQHGECCGYFTTKERRQEFIKQGYKRLGNMLVPSDKYLAVCFGKLTLDELKQIPQY